VQLPLRWAGSGSSQAQTALASVRMSEPEFLTGRILLAMPGMFDPSFDHAAIAMCLHDERGALGIGIGHVRGDITFHEILEELDIAPGEAPDCAVHHGGPVETGRGFILHSADWAGEETIEVAGLCRLSTSREILVAITEGAGPRQWLIALGYAGWGPGQLDEEMRHHGWFAADGRPEILFETSAEARWTATWRAQGVDPSLLSSVTGRA
jgi:putative transcriptional regulator